MPETTPPAKQVTLDDLSLTGHTKTVAMKYADLLALYNAGAASPEPRVQEAAARLVALLDDYRPPAAEDAQPRPLDLSHLRNLGISAEEWGRRWDAAVAEATPADAALATARIERDEAQHDAERCAAERDAAIRRAEDAVAERDRLAAQIAAVIRTAREALIHAERLCRYHADTPPAHPPWHGGCDSCKQPTRVRAALAAIDTAQRATLATQDGPHDD